MEESFEEEDALLDEAHAAPIKRTSKADLDSANERGAPPQGAPPPSTPPAALTCPTPRMKLHEEENSTAGTP